MSEQTYTADASPPGVVSVEQASIVDWPIDVEINVIKDDGMVLLLREVVERIEYIGEDDVGYLACSSCGFNHKEGEEKLHNAGCPIAYALGRETR